MDRITIPNITFNTHNMTVSNTGSGILSTFSDVLDTDERSEIEKLFGLTKEEIYKEYGISFKENKISFNGEWSRYKTTFQIENDAAAKLWLIQKGFIKYVRGKEIWNEEAIEHGWENAWTPPENYKAPKKSKELGHVYFVESQGYWKIGRATAARIKIRIKEQQPDKVLAVSPITSKFKTLERKLHKMFKDKRVLKYEVFRNLNKDDIKVIMNELGNKINVDI